MPERILFCGQKPVGELCFAELLGNRQGRLEVVGAVSNPDTSVWWRTAEIRRLALDHGIPFVSNADRMEGRIKELCVDRGVTALLSVQHPWILSREILETVGGRAWNLHSARLPEYGGHNAVNHAILNGETSFTSTLHWMVSEVDSGDVAYSETFPLSGTETAQRIYARGIRAGQAAFKRLLDALVAGKAVPRSSLDGEARFYPRDSIDPLRRIQDPHDASEVDRKARAFWFPPFEPAYFDEGSRRFHVVPDTGSEWWRDAYFGFS